uniref:nuclear transport factor 2 family protein n=1 Tax=Fulvivirga sp. TaxID=1931237 RepID=UPI00404A9EDF
MPIINVKTDCGNAPKREFLKDFRIAMAKGNQDFLLNSVTDDIVWNVVGWKLTEGKDSYSKELKKMLSNDTKGLTIHQILSHGKEGAINGTIETETGDVIEFSEFYVFQGAKGDKIKSIITYLIQVK